MDIVFIHELKIKTTIGVFDWERQIKQMVSLDLEMACDINKAAASDKLEDALDYKRISKRIIEFVEGSSFELVERLAERVANIVLHEFGVPWLRLTLSKPGALRGAKDVGIRIERGKQPA